MSTEFSCFLTLREKISAFWQSVSGKDVRKSHFRVHMIVSTQKHCVKTYAFFFFSDIERKFFDLSAKNCSGLIFKTGIYESKGKIWKKFFEKLFFLRLLWTMGKKMFVALAWILSNGPSKMNSTRPEEYIQEQKEKKVFSPKNNFHLFRTLSEKFFSFGKKSSANSSNIIVRVQLNTLKTNLW